jgi:hypothetical protein
MPSSTVLSSPPRDEDSDEDSVRGDMVSVRQDLLFGPSVNRPSEVRVLRISRSLSGSSSERGLCQSRPTSPVTRTQDDGPRPFKEEGLAGDLWHPLLRKYPESTRELLFRLPWHTAPGVTLPNGVPRPCVTRVVCKSVPLDLTWRQATLALNASTPLNLVGTRLCAGSKDLLQNHAVRQSRVPTFTTIGILGREPGGAEGDSDSEDSDGEMPLEIPQFVQKRDRH